MNIMNNTNYPHLDKPWMKYYDKKYVDIPFSKDTIYDFFIKNVQEHLSSVATDFYGYKITYSKMIDNINNLAKGLVASGVKKEDRILSILPTLSITANLFYATSQIGAVSDFYDPRPDSVNFQINGKKILDIIKGEKIKHIVVLDQCYEPFFSKIEDELKSIGIESIIIFSLNDALNNKAQFGYLFDEIDKNGFNLESLTKLKGKLAGMKKNEEHVKEVLSKSKLRIINYSDLISNGRYTNVENNVYTPNQLALIVHTSGTSGAMPKPIPLTNENLNIHVQQIFATGEKYLPTDSVFHLLPYFASFGVGDVAHYGFCCGAKMIQIPEFTPDDLSRRIYRTKPNMVIAAPTMLNPLMDTPYLKGKDLSFLKRITVGGGEFPREAEMLEFLKQHNAESCRLEYGYGMSECTGSACLRYNKQGKIGTIGIPLPFTNYAIVDVNTGKPLKFDETHDVITGEAYISSGCVTLGKIDGKVIVPHYIIDDIDFIKTGDLVNMDRDGNISFDTRIDRTFTRFDGFKYKPYIMEQIIAENSYVSECIIHEYYDDDKKGSMPIANIVLKNEYKNINQYEVVKSILEQLINNSTISTRQIPTKVRFLDEMPLTKNSKYNYKYLLNLTLDDTVYTIDIDETNLAVGDIRIISPSSSKKRIKKK